MRFMGKKKSIHRNSKGEIRLTAEEAGILRAIYDREQESRAQMAAYMDRMQPGIVYPAQRRVT